MGLAISSKLVHRLGGTMSVDSELGCWTEFAVELPLLQLEEGAQCQSLDTSTMLSLVQKAKICLVDQNPVVLERMKRVFEHFRMEHQVMTSLPSQWEKDGEPQVLMVQEDLWTGDVQLPPKFVVITTGMHYLVQNTHGHIRSLLQTVPYNILSCIAASLQSGTSASMEVTNGSGAEQFELAVALESLSILIAEDNRINQKVLVRILNRLGIEDVTVAVNGQEAVDYVKGGKDYDVVLMDMQMPVMDGLEACTMIRNSVLEKRPKVVFVTAHALGSYEKECYKAGAADFLSKPCNIDSVKQVLERTMRKRASSSN